MTEMSMIERVKRAIQEADVRWYSERFPTVTPETIRGIAEDEFSDNYNALARAAIEAMREPTDAMVDAMDEYAGTIAPAHAYEAAIDAALNEQEAG